MTDAGATGELAQRELDALRLAQDLIGDPDDITTQVAVMLGTLLVPRVWLGHATTQCHIVVVNLYTNPQPLFS